LWGVGPVNERDEHGRYYIYSKTDGANFPSVTELTDSIAILAFIYGDSQELEIA
jgi:hypothetical protein